MENYRAALDKEKFLLMYYGKGTVCNYSCRGINFTNPHNPQNSKHFNLVIRQNPLPVLLKIQNTVFWILFVSIVYQF